MMLEIQVLAWDRHKKCGTVEMGSQPFSLDNWISNGNTYAYFLTHHAKGQLSF
jgi:hypothetical protein